MKKKLLINTYKRASALFRDAAHAGHLPGWFQGSIRSLSASHSNSEQAGIPKGIVLGVPRAYWEDVEAAYPEWDLMFARRSTLPETLVAEVTRHGLRVIIGPVPRRSHVVALQTHGFGALRLSPAPLPQLLKGKTFARGFVLEPSTPWLTGRRQSEMELLVSRQEIVARPVMRKDATLLAELLAVPENLAGPILVLDETRIGRQWTAQEEAAIDQFSKLHKRPLKRLDIELEGFWKPEQLSQFHDALAGSSDVVAKQHPLAAAALLLGRRPIVGGQMFLSESGFYRKLGDKKKALKGVPLVDQRILQAVCVLLAARYVSDGVIVDPLAFLGHAKTAELEAAS